MIKKIKQRLLHYSWDLAFGHYQESIYKDGLSCDDYQIVVNPYKTKWFADPFIYKDSPEQLELFVEEFDFAIGRGRIGHLVISKRSRRIEGLSIILEKETHLSFPAIYRVNDVVYVHPENSASGKSFMYRYDKDLDCLIDPVEISEDPLTDAIIVKRDGLFVMYTTKLPVPNGRELFLYQAGSFLGPYEYKESQVFDKAYARMAGAFVKMGNGAELRPAQDCEGGDYGKAVHFMDGSAIVTTILPPSKLFAGLHTFNTLGNTFVVDFKRYDFPWIYSLKKRLL